MGMVHGTEDMLRLRLIVVDGLSGKLWQIAGGSWLLATAFFQAHFPILELARHEI